MRPLGVAVDLENLEGRLGGVFALLDRLDPASAELVLVGGHRAQRNLERYRLPATWKDVAEILRNTGEPEAADAIIHQRIDTWRGERRVIVLASRDGGFDRALAGAAASGCPVFVLGTEGTAVRLLAVAPGLAYGDVREITESAATITRARRSEKGLRH